MHQAKVVELKKLNKKIHHIKLKVNPNQNFSFTTGQFISINVAPEQYRPYSIASSSKYKNKIELIITAQHNGKGANYIRNLKLDDVVNFNGPFGVFTLKQSIHNNYAFIATGAGIAPILPMITDLLEQDKTSNIHLYFGVSNKSQVFYLSKLKTLKNKYPNFNFDLCLSKENKDLKFKYKKSRVTQAINIKNDCNYYICGNPNMVKDIRDLLQQNNIDKNNIHFEKFTIQNPS